MFSLILNTFTNHSPSHTLCVSIGQNNRGYAFVEYQTHKAAAKARRKLVPCKIKIRGVEVTVDWATPLHECGEILNPFNSLLVKNIRDNAKNDELCQFYSLRNKLRIIKFKRLPNKLIISFNSREDAERAMQIYEGKLRIFPIRFPGC